MPILVVLVALTALLAPTLSGRLSASADSLPPIGWSSGASLPTSFTPRWDMAFAYFPPTDSVVMFGGAPQSSSGTWMNDTWMFHAGAWSSGPGAPAALTPRGGAAIAYDPSIGRIVLFGGAGPTWPPDNDTWLFDGTSWTPGPAAPAGLAGRTGAEMAYDPNSGDLVLFGGSGTAGFDDTWLFNGTAWVPGPATPAAMAPRAFFAMAYDPTLGGVLVAGGDGGTDTWVFTGSGWIPGPSLAGGPGAVERVSMTYDPDLGGDLVFGGEGPGASSSKLWLLRGGAWLRVPNAKTNPGWPAPRMDAGLVWSPAEDAAMLFCGAQGGSAQPALTDTWFFRDTAPQVASVSVTPTAPARDQSVSLTTGTLSGGYASTSHAYRWLLNGAVVTGATGALFKPVDALGDTIQAQVQMHDALGLYGPWVSSNVVTVGGGTVRNSGGSPTTSGAAVVPAQPAPPGIMGPAQPVAPTPGGPGTQLVTVTAPAPTRPEPAPGPRGSLAGPATGQVVARDGGFWVGSSPIALRGFMIETSCCNEATMAQVAGWGANFIRLRIHWSKLEPTAPVHNPDGSWTHAWSSTYMSQIVKDITWAQQYGLYVLVSNYGTGGSYFSYPDWLFQAAYNSHGLTYAKTAVGRAQARTNLWSDQLQQQFTASMYAYVAAQLAGVPGVVGYEVMNEPQQGNLPNDHATTQTMLNWQLSVAQAIRAADPPRLIVFETRFGFGPGLPAADLSGWAALGNVAFDLHDYFGARWGAGLNTNPASLTHLETSQDIFDNVNTPGVPPYLGTTLSHERFIQLEQSGLASFGIPLMVGEFGDLATDPGVTTYYGTVTSALNDLGVSWTADYDGPTGVVASGGTLQPWGSIVISALTG